MLQFASKELQADYCKASRQKPESGPHPGGINYNPPLLSPKLWRGGVKGKGKTEGANAGYVQLGQPDYEVNGHQPFDWDGYYVKPDLTMKARHYDISDHYEAKYCVDYVETE